MRGVTPALSACWRPLRRRLVEGGKATASPRRSPENSIETQGTRSIPVARSRMAPRDGQPRPSIRNNLGCQTSATAPPDAKSVSGGLANRRPQPRDSEKRDDISTSKAPPAVPRAPSEQETRAIAAAAGQLSPRLTQGGSGGLERRCARLWPN